MIVGRFIFGKHGKGTQTCPKGMIYWPNVFKLVLPKDFGEPVTQPFEFIGALYRK